MKTLVLTLIFLSITQSVFAEKNLKKDPAVGGILLTEYTEKINPTQIQSYKSFKSSDGNVKGYILENVKGGAIAPSELVVCLIHKDEPIDADDVVTSKCYNSGVFSGEPSQIEVTGSGVNYFIRFRSRAPNADSTSVVNTKVALEVIFNSSDKSIKSVNVYKQPIKK